MERKNATPASPHGLPAQDSPLRRDKVRPHEQFSRPTVPA